MTKKQIKLSQLKRIFYSPTRTPEDRFIEQELSYSNEGSYTHYYKCPCGKGRVVDDKDDTPGFRSHDRYIECPVCRVEHEIIN